MKIIEYKIIKHANQTAMTRIVTDAMVDGWQPLGGVGFTSCDFTQAMVKYDTSDEVEALRQLNDIHSGIVHDLANVIQNYFENQSYPRSVTIAPK